MNLSNLGMLVESTLAKVPRTFCAFRTPQAEIVQALALPLPQTTGSLGKQILRE